MRIAVYAIARDEVRHVERFVAACEGADLIMVADTGSTDGTVDLLRQRGATVWPISLKPFRFDDARNASLALLPSDIDVCIALDLDEVLNPGWAAALRSEWTPGTTRGRYLYHWSHLPDGSPGVSFWTDKIHARFGYRWRHPCHEALYPDRSEDIALNLRGVWIDHWADATKSRSMYLTLLELAVHESPQESRHAYYLGREYSLIGRHQEAETELRRYLSLPTATWREQNVNAMRMIAKARRHAGDHEATVIWLRRAVETVPGLRDAWVDLAEQFYRGGQWPECLQAIETALAIPPKPTEFDNNPRNSAGHPHDVAAVAAWRLGRHSQALTHAERALELSPDEARYARNAARMRQSCSVK